MLPIDDHRPFAEVLRDWMALHALTYAGAADRLGRGRGSIGRALKGEGIAYERDLRALMTLISEGRG